MSGAAITLGAEQVRQFERDGYCVVPDVFDAEVLATLRRESDLAIAWQEDAIRRNASGVENLNRLGERYFVPRRSLERPALRELILGERLARLCAPLLGSEAFLFLEVFVHKAPRSESHFLWHQDHGYVAHYGFGRFPPNLTVWAPLDDVTADNGALWVWPFSEGAVREPVPHRVVEATNDCVLDVDDSRARCVPMPAGGLLLMSGLLPHMSGPNRTSVARRAYQWQYSRVPILDGDAPVMMAEPLLRDGAWVGRPGQPT